MPSTDAVWELIKLSRWVLKFVEKLMKQCVLSSMPVSPAKTNEMKLGNECYTAEDALPLMHGLY